MLSLITLVAVGTPAVGLVTYAIVKSHERNDLNNNPPNKQDWYK